MSLLKFINMFILQWFFVRLTKCSEKRVFNFVYDNVFNIPHIDWDITQMSLKSQSEIRTYEWYSIQTGILPLTGWGKEFKYLKPLHKFIKITKPKLKEIN